jgi:hypothetical protein
MQKVNYYLSILGFFLLSSNVNANDDNDIGLCFQAASAVERDNNIPPNLVSAISLTETGKTRIISNGSKIFSPWPWTINSEGKGYFFKTKQEAIAKVIELKQQGKKSIDVGCMQINLYYHGDAFDNLEAAFDPYTNMSYGAYFLKELYTKHGSWQSAIERYHSGTKIYYDRYRVKVIANWQRERKRTIFTNNAPIQKLNHFQTQRLQEIARLRAQIREDI